MVSESNYKHYADDHFVTILLTIREWHEVVKFYVLTACSNSPNWETPYLRKLCPQEIMSDLIKLLKA